MNILNYCEIQATLVGEGFFVLTTGIVPQHEKLQRKLISQYTYNVACMERYPDHTENFMREQCPSPILDVQREGCFEAQFDTGDNFAKRL